MGKAPVYFSETITIGPNTYLMEVKRSQRGQKYFLITKTNARPEEDQAVVVFEYAMGRFVKMIDRAAHAMYNTVPEIEPRERSRAPRPAKPAQRTVPAKPPKQPPERPSKPKTPRASLDQIRKKHPNAYRSWTEEEDAKLAHHFHKDVKMVELEKIFGRPRSAIRIRLKRLGLAQ